MTTTSVALSQALARASDRTARLLWRPFDARTWFVLAFAQFLASLPPDAWGGGGNVQAPNWQAAGDEIESVWERLVAGGVILALVVVGVVLLLALIVALVWVSSRGKFVFLDDVLQGRAQIVEPWKRFQREGNSLFWCTIALFFIGCGVLVVAILGVIATVGLAGLRHPGPTTIVALLIAGSLVALLVFVLGYAAFCLQAFVVPLMHRYRIGAMDAWRRFFVLWSASPIPFIVAGLVVIVGFVVLLVAGAAFGFMTCCLGFVLLMAPYFSNVLLLPVSVFYRAFTVEFLAQFDHELLAPPPAPAPLVI